MADTKWSQFPNGTFILDTDTLVGLRAGANVQFNPTEVLLSAKNLSDVADADTSRINLSAPKTSSGVGSPQGVVAGELGDLYIDTTAPTDKFYVCVVAGTALTAVWQLQTNLAGALLIANNLSDVANPVTSLSNIGGQPITVVGSGNPNGTQAGTAGISLYFDTSGVQLWICTQTGTALTAVWAIQNQQGGGIDTINLTSPAPVQMLSNKLYIGTVSSPSPAVGIMPIAPTPGDIIIIYAAATAGVTIQKGTAGVINVTNNLVTTSLFVPFRNTLVLRCSNAAAGGQWFSESIDDTVIIDGTTTVGYQPINIVGSGDPNGSRAGVQGINFYFDTSTSQIWICTQTGDASTAVWQIQNESGMETVDLNLVTPIQMVTNKLYVGRISSPSPAIGIMPIAPNPGDVIIIYAAAAQGVTVQVGTAGLVNITNNLVSFSFFIPFRNTIVLRCFSAVSGGQWFSESVDDTVIIDGTTTVGYQPLNITGTGNPNGSIAGLKGINFYFENTLNQLWQCIQTGTSLTAVWNRIVNESNSATPYRFYFSSLIGNDTTGNGSEDFPYATYAGAAAAALLVATPSTPATVFAMNKETSASMVIYPFVYISGYDSNVSVIECSGTISLDSSFDSTPNATCIISNVSISAATGINFVISVSQNQQVIFSHSMIYNTPSVNIEGTGSSSNPELFAFFSGVVLPPNSPPPYIIKNAFGVFSTWSADNISFENDSITGQSILLLADNAFPNDLGDITITSSSPALGAILFSRNSGIDTLTMDGDATTTIWDVVSYTPSITFTGGASLSNIQNISVSEGLTVNYTSLNYTPIGTSTYRADSTTAHLNGIDDALLPVSVNSPDVYADLAGSTVNINAGANSQLLFTNEVYDPTNSYNSTTCTFTAPIDGRYEFMYDLNIDGTGGALNNNYWMDSAFFKNATFLDTSYCSNRFSDTTVGIVRLVNNSGFTVAQLTAGDTMNVRAVNNGNINLIVQNANFSVKYLGP